MIENDKIPIILDTDIGSDIDDTWALGMALNSPELDIKLISICSLNPIEGAKIVAKFLQNSGRTDIPIAIGISKYNKVYHKPLRQSDWVKNYNLDSFPGVIHKNGIQAIANVINAAATETNNSKSKINKMKIVGIGPLTNIGKLISDYPEVVKKSLFIGMQGSIYKGYMGKNNPSAEYNISMDIKAARRVFRADWEKIITPLDTSGEIYLKGDFYKRVYNSNKIIPKLIMENYKIWAKKGRFSLRKVKTQSSCLYDTVAIYLAYFINNLVFETLKIDIDDNGYMIVVKKQQNNKWINIGNYRANSALAEENINNSWIIRAAIDWENKNNFYNHLAERLTN
ncbi:MAG: nucleoside hydrolase [Promethearchaeota archaeon]